MHITELRTWTRRPTAPALPPRAIRASLMRPANRLPKRPPTSRPDTLIAAAPASAKPFDCSSQTQGVSVQAQAWHRARLRTSQRPVFWAVSQRLVAAP